MHMKPGLLYHMPFLPPCQCFLQTAFSSGPPLEPWAQAQTWANNAEQEPLPAWLGQQVPQPLRQVPVAAGWAAQETQYQQQPRWQQEPPHQLQQHWQQLQQWQQPQQLQQVQQLQQWQQPLQQQWQQPQQQQWQQPLQQQWPSFVQSSASLQANFSAWEPMGPWPAAPAANTAPAVGDHALLSAGAAQQAAMLLWDASAVSVAGAHPTLQPRQPPTSCGLPESIASLLD